MAAFSSALQASFLSSNHIISRHATQRKYLDRIVSKKRFLTSASLDGKGEEIVIIGGGVAGLSAAVALHRVGLSSLVLEQSSELRMGGAALSLWGNGWRALDAMDVSNALRPEYDLLTRVEICSKSGDLLREFTIEECVNGPHEVRGVHRSTLLNTLAENLPAGSIRFGSRPTGYTVDPGTGNITVKLESGQNIETRVLLGCDGGRSSVGEWLQVPHPTYCGYGAFRGIAPFPDGHDLGSTIRMVWGQGVRAGMYPLNAKEVYWFTCFNTPEERGQKYLAEEMKSIALSTVKGWAFGMEEVIERTEDSAVSFSAINDRWTLPLPGCRWGRGGATLLGDAAHPMTPNLGQGACTALEDAVIIAQKLAGASSKVKGGDGMEVRSLGDAESIAKCLEEFDRERIMRTAPLTVRSHAMGAVLQLPFAPVCFLRDRVALPFVLKTDHFLDHALFDCGDLPPI